MLWWDGTRAFTGWSNPWSVLTEEGVPRSTSKRPREMHPRCSASWRSCRPMTCRRRCRRKSSGRSRSSATRLALRIASLRSAISCCPGLNKNRWCRGAQAPRHYFNFKVNSRLWRRTGEICIFDESNKIHIPIWYNIFKFDGLKY